MSQAEVLLGGPTLAAEREEVAGPWIRSRRWDLLLLTGTAVLVPIPILLHAVLHGGFGVEQYTSATIVAMVVMLALGGPHVYVTATRTVLEPQFIRRHPIAVWASLLIPVATIYLAVNHKTLFLTLFFGVASVHVVHQIAYITGCYQRKAGRTPWWSAAADYAVMLGLFPGSITRLVHGTFTLDGEQLFFPGFLRSPVTAHVVWTAYAFVVVWWVMAIVSDRRRGLPVLPRVALVGTTVGISLWLPFVGNLDVAFQGFNAWHCAQYLALTWYLNRLRWQRGEISRPWVQKMSAPGTTRWYYAQAVAATLLLLGVIFIVKEASGLTPLIAYYAVAKSLLLMHYYFDAILFFRFSDAVPQPAAG